ncbi:MAG: hypothetical protein K6E20_07625 [Acholeplasmatales bacterium]|nr:hypothetical protein [Acholeplasmatales bacterium]
MKHIRVYIISFLCFMTLLIFGFKAYAGDTFRYEWFNTNIYLNIGESPNEYKNVPRAILYRNNLALESDYISYDTNGDWMYYFKNINTSKVGTYYVWYKAFDSKYIPGTCTNYKCLIAFHVVDNVKPTVEVVKDQINVKRGSTFDYENNIVYKDNYSNECTIKLISGADLNTVGTYDVLMSVTDEYNNTSKISYEINVYDDSKPSIIFSGSFNTLSINVNSSIDMNQYFQAFDPYDGDISNKIIYPPLDTSEIGSYEYTVSVTNTNNVTEYYTININIVDDITPKMTLMSRDIILDYKFDIDEYPFYDNVIIEDNTQINYDNLSINHNIVNAVGVYDIWYTYTDGSYQVSDTARVSLVSYKAPDIEIIDNVEIKKNTNIDLFSYVIVSDESDPNIESSLTIDDSNVDYNKKGSYTADVFCMNSSGLSTTKKMIINVVGSKKSSNTALIVVSINLIVVWVLLIGLVVGFIIYKKRKRNNEY